MSTQDGVDRSEIDFPSPQNPLNFNATLCPMSSAMKVPWLQKSYAMLLLLLLHAILLVPVGRFPFMFVQVHSIPST